MSCVGSARGVPRASGESRRRQLGLNDVQLKFQAIAAVVSQVGPERCMYGADKLGQYRRSGGACRRRKRGYEPERAPKCAAEWVEVAISRSDEDDIEDVAVLGQVGQLEVDLWYLVLWYS